MRTPHNERLTPDIADPARPRKAERQKSCAASEAERRCILTGETGTRGGLLRLAVSPPNTDGACQVLPDPAAKAPGRGAWITLDRAALEAALADGHLKRALMRAFKGAKLIIPDDLPGLIEAALTKTLTDRLGLELRAGKLVLGSGRISDQARMGRIGLLLHASDSSEDGRKTLDQAWRVGREAQGSGIRGTVLALDRAALSVALGRDNVVHLALSDAGAAGRVNRAMARLSDYTGALQTGCNDGAAGRETDPQGASDDTLNT